MNRPGLLVVLSGPSGVGKDTVLGRFMERNEDCVLSVSATTRAPRPGEVHGRDYFFLARERFGGQVAQGEMLEYAEYGGNYYGTPRSEVDKQLALGKNVILEIEVQGAMQIKKIRPEAVFVFLMPPSWNELKDRLESRGTESVQAVNARLEAARQEMSRAGEYDYIIVNDSVEECCERLRAVVTAAGCTTANMRQFVQEVCHGNA